MCSKLPTVLLSATLVLVQQALAFPNAPGGCGIPPVGGPHLTAPTVISNTLEDAGITVSIDGVALSPGASFQITADTEATIVVAAEEGLTYRGILIRIERSDGQDASGTLMSGDLTDAVACVAPVTGVGHSDRSDKSTSTATLRIADIVDATLHVTTVFSNRDGVSSYASSGYSLNVVVVHPPCELCK